MLHVLEIVDWEDVKPFMTQFESLDADGSGMLTAEDLRYGAEVMQQEVAQKMEEALAAAAGPVPSNIRLPSVRKARHGVNAMRAAFEKDRLGDVRASTRDSKASRSPDEKRAGGKMPIGGRASGASARASAQSAASATKAPSSPPPRVSRGSIEADSVKRNKQGSVFGVQLKQTEEI